MSLHIQAKKDEVAKVVLMPGDPLRAKYIANKYLKNVKQINSIRNMLMYTGTYKNRKVTVAGSGMGCPSIGIYSYELFKSYDVDVIIRIGTAGAYTANLNINDLVSIKDSYSESSFAKLALNYDKNIIEASKNIYNLISKVAKDNNILLKDNIRTHTSDVFYNGDSDYHNKLVKKYHTEVVEMESFALFTNARVTNKQAACLLTISDSFISEKKLTAFEREQTLDNMIKLALETSLEIK